MTHVFHRRCGAVPPMAARGDGPYIIDSTGRRYFDASGGAAVSCLGHSHPRVIAAIKDQLDQIPFAHTGFFTNEPMERLADHLTGRAPGLDYVYFVSGGSEAMEAAIKLARQYFLERGEGQRSKIIARRQSYHGNTLGALAAGGNQWRRQQFEPLLTDVSLVSPCYAYRGQAAGETEDAYADRLSAELEDEIVRLGPDTVMAFLAETVVGATAGAVPPVAGYLKRVREVCDRHGILLILDEVMCGMGRTGHLYACAEDGVAPDILAIAKGLGAGYQPIGATLVAGKIYDAIAAGSGFFQHGHTYMGHATACAAALAVQSVIEEDDLLANVRARGDELRTALSERFGDHPHVGDIRGRGLFIGMELVADRQTKEPLAPTLGVNKTVKAQAMSAGLMCYPMGGTIDGKRGDHILLAPPFIMDASHVDLVVDRLGIALDAALPVAAAAQ